MDFPARPPDETTPPEIPRDALGVEAIYVLESRDFLAVFEDENIIQNMRPDFDKITKSFRKYIC